MKFMGIWCVPGAVQLPSSSLLRPYLQTPKVFPSCPNCSHLVHFSRWFSGFHRGAVFVSEAYTVTSPRCTGSCVIPAPPAHPARHCPPPTPKQRAQGLPPAPGQAPHPPSSSSSSSSRLFCTRSPRLLSSTFLSSCMALGS